MQKTITQYLQFLHLAENLKKELRHSWLSNRRQESVADHSWRMGLMVILFAPQLEIAIDVTRSLKMAIIHDLVEIEAGDVPTFEMSLRKAMKQQNEQNAIEKIRTLLGAGVGQEIYDLWQEYEANETHEARFLHALDKLEVSLQHNEADLSTWNEWERNFFLTGNAESCAFDKFLLAVSEVVREESKAKLAAEKLKCSVD